MDQSNVLLAFFWLSVGKINLGKFRKLTTPFSLVIFCGSTYVYLPMLCTMLNFY